MGLNFLNFELQMLCIMNCKKINKCRDFSRLFHTYDHSRPWKFLHQIPGLSILFQDLYYELCNNNCTQKATEHLELFMTSLHCILLSFTTYNLHYLVYQYSGSCASYTTHPANHLQCLTSAVCITALVSASPMHWCFSSYIFNYTLLLITIAAERFSLNRRFNDPT